MRTLTDVDYAKIGYAAMRECRIAFGKKDFPLWSKLPKYMQDIYTDTAKKCRANKFSDIIGFLQYVSKQLRKHEFVYSENYSEKMKRHPFVGELSNSGVQMSSMVQSVSFMITAMSLAIMGTNAIERFTKHPG